MTSTYLSYRLYAADYAKSVQRTLADPQVAREQEYYRENIGNVTSVDDLLNDKRLFAYAMKAYGLEDMTYATAFVRKVLESDLSDDNSFANKLTDSRYLEFAKAFNFSTDGSIAADETVVQDDGDLEDVVGLYSEQRTRKGIAVAAEVEYYQTRMATITSADEFVADERLFNFALTAYGIDASIASESAIKAVISGDLSGVANSTQLSKYQALADAFSFEADGSVAEGGQAQTSQKIQQTVYLNYDANGAAETASAAAFNTDVYNEAVAGLTSVDDLLNNDIVRDYALIAAGIDPSNVSDEMVRNILTSDLSDSESYANSDPTYAKLASKFNFNADGGLDEGVTAQTSEQQEETVTLYYANFETDALEWDQDNTDLYKQSIGLISSIDDLINDSQALQYVLEAFGVDPDSVTTDEIRKVLTSDPSDPFSYAALTRDTRLQAMAEAFNFDADGQAQGQLQAQLASAKDDTIARYEATLGEYDYQKEAGQAESDYYSSVVDSVETVDELLVDTRVVAYLKKAYDLESETEPLFNQKLRAALVSNVADPDSFVNQSGNDAFRELARAFNFASDGTANRASVAAAQDANALVDTQDRYIRQTMEESAGEQSEGARLALYFQRNAADITSGYSILADSALMEVVMTALSLPDEAANMDTDALASLIEKRIDFDDFKDPEKLEKFISGFAALYDVNNSQSTAASTTALLNQSPGIGQDLLANIQTMYLQS